MNKFQITSTKLQINLKSKAPNYKQMTSHGYLFAVCYLSFASTDGGLEFVIFVIVIYLLFVICNLAVLRFCQNKKRFTRLIQTINRDANGYLALPSVLEKGPV